ncbi:MAG: hypothetical protein M3275_14760 [Thermoproteota archaeon]|nr:hypothetical protein [Thermoproteota archaeon]
MGEIRTDVKLRDHQKKALSELHDGAILWGGVGSGKTRVGLAYYMLTEEHEDLYVITTAKKRDSLDWVTEAARFGIGRERDATFAGVLTVDSWNNIDKYTSVENAFFIFDEQRLVGSGAWVKAFLKIAKKNRWIMLSATPGDNWLDYIPVMVANGFYKNRTEFKREHVIYAPFTKYPKVERYVNVQRLVRQRNKILIKMPYEKETVRHPINCWCEFDEKLMARVSKQMWNPYKEEPIRDIAEKFHVMRRVVNSDPSRLQHLYQLMQKHPRLIVFYNFNYELDILRQLREKLPYAEWNGQNHEEIPETDKWVYVVQYAAGAEGWNCTTTDATCFWSLTYSYKLWEQAHGRIDRINTPFQDLYYYTLRSQAPIDWAIWRSLKAKRSFQPSHYEMLEDEFLHIRLGHDE